MTEKISYIPTRIKNAAKGGHVTGTEDIIDDALGKTQAEINVGTYAALAELSPDQTGALALATDVNALKRAAIRGDVKQSLTDAQKAQALANMGISGIDDEPTAGSENLVKSGGVYKINTNINGAIRSIGLTYCNTDGDVAQKTISSDYINLFSGFRKSIMFSNDNTADDCTLSINGEIAKPLFLNNKRVSSSNTVYAGVKYILTFVGGNNYYLTEFDKDTYERNSNKVTSLSSSSTDAEYPSAKCVYDYLQKYQIKYYTNKTIINNGRIGVDGTLIIDKNSSFRILDFVDIPTLLYGQQFVYSGVTIAKTASQASLYYRYLASDGTTIVGVGELTTEDVLVIPVNAKYLQFCISQNDLNSFNVYIEYLFQEKRNADKSLRFAVFSDLHYGIGGNDADRVQGVYDAVVDEMITSHLDFIIFNGDMVDCSNTTKDPDSEYSYLYEHLISKIKCPIFFTLGNHDGVTSIKTLEQYYLKGVQSSMETDMFYFIFLNSYYLGNRDSNIPKKWAYDGTKRYNYL